MDKTVKAQVFVLVIKPYYYCAKAVDKIDNAVSDFVWLWFCLCGFFFVFLGYSFMNNMKFNSFFAECCVNL